jgi:putative inorganic carbon (HCO3(-)) transporter
MHTRQDIELTTDQPAWSPAEGAGRGWDLLLLCLSGFILTSVARIHQLFPALAVLRPVTLTGLLALVLLLIDRVPRRRIGTLNIPATRHLLLLVAWMALSVPGALWPGGAFTTFVDFAKTALIFLVIVTAVRSVRDVERLTLVYFLGAAIYAAVVLSRLGFQLTAEGRVERLYFYDSNDFATYALTALPLGVYFALTSKRLLRYVAIAGIAVLLLGFVWTGSRGGFLALLAVVAYFLLRYTTVRRSWRWSTVVAIAVLATATVGDKYWTRISTVFRPTQDYNLTEEQGRMQIWRRGVGYMLAHPVLGVGAGNFPRAEGTISPLVERQPRGRSLKWGPPHNSYVQVFAELGVPGFIIFAAFFISVFRALAAPPAGRARLAHTLTASLIGFAVGSFFLTLAYNDMLYTLAAIAVGLHQVGLNAARAQRRAAPLSFGAAPLPASGQ